MLTSLYFFDFRTKKPLLLSLSIRLFGNAFMYANRILRLVLQGQLYYTYAKMQVQKGDDFMENKNLIDKAIGFIQKNFKDNLSL